MFFTSGIIYIELPDSAYIFWFRFLIIPFYGKYKAHEILTFKRSRQEYNPSTDGRQENSKYPLRCFATLREIFALHKRLPEPYRFGVKV